MLYNFYDNRKPAPLDLSEHIAQASINSELMKTKRRLIIEKNKCKDKDDRDLLSTRILAVMCSIELNSKGIKL